MDVAAPPSSADVGTVAAPAPSTRDENQAVADEAEAEKTMVGAAESTALHVRPAETGPIDPTSMSVPPAELAIAASKSSAGSKT